MDDLQEFDDIRVWASGTTGVHSSNYAIFSEKTSDVHECVRDIIREMQRLKGQKSVDPLRVLFLHSGIDGLTTDNTSWRALQERFPDVQFSVTSLCPIRLAEDHPSVFTTRKSLVWTHHEVSDLAVAYTAPQRAYPYVCEDSKSVRWVYWLDAFYEHKRAVQNGKVSSTGFGQRLTTLLTRLLVHRNKLMEQVAAPEGFAEAEKCKNCQGTETSYRWLRGVTRKDAVRCDQCPLIKIPVYAIEYETSGEISPSREPKNNKRKKRKTSTESPAGHTSSQLKAAIPVPAEDATTYTCSQGLY
ncbi:hypothetical protein CC86DRAFT_405009 [Ophiobolus disseminans]|uniref:Uncharacterized protein n=1 Tax=Ophiobolus disseminans TaxID=1469910 RepID=A0A6A7A5G6_9PLEO|nr:hypothetical protein CC86DRAFT_405009 [Ophiobolus disseminans]